MLPLSPVKIIEALLPGLIALTSILVVVIAFLLERYIPVRSATEGEAYRKLVWCMTIAFTIAGIDSILSLSFLLGIGDIMGEKDSLVCYATILILFGVSILLIIVGMIITVKKILKRGR